MERILSSHRLLATSDQLYAAKRHMSTEYNNLQRFRPFVGRVGRAASTGDERDHEGGETSTKGRSRRSRLFVSSASAHRASPSSTTISVLPLLSFSPFPKPRFSPRRGCCGRQRETTRERERERRNHTRRVGEMHLG